MPVYEITSQKRLGTEYWTNVYHVNESNIDTAIATGLTIVNGYEKSFHRADVEFTSYRTRPSIAGGESTITPLGVFGLVASGDNLPLFCTLNVVFATSVGRPSRKYYRLPIVEGEQTGGSLTPGALAAYQTAFAAMKADPDVAGLCDVDGQVFYTIRPEGRIGMRQLRRGSKRTTPVI